MYNKLIINIRNSWELVFAKKFHIRCC